MRPSPMRKRYSGRQQQRNCQYHNNTVFYSPNANPNNNSDDCEMSGATGTTSPLPMRVLMQSGDHAFNSMKEIRQWPLFSLLSDEFLSSIRMACVFGTSANEGLIFMHDNEVYGVGTNTYSCLGLVNNTSCLEAHKVEALLGKCIVGVAYGCGPHVVVCTDEGELFSWGYNGYGQLGNGSTNQMLVPSLVTTNLMGKKIVEVACGSHHTLALTLEGEVYAWGYNNQGQIGSGNSSNQETPRRVTACLGNKHVISVACGHSSSMALVSTGEAYGWGYNGNGQLGVSNTTNQTNPCRVASLQDIMLSQLVCGHAHTLALADDGSLYAWGANSFGQVGIGTKNTVATPVRVGECLGNFVEIAACHYSHISVAMLQYGKVYMWGQCRGQTVTEPYPTSFTSLHEVFAAFASPSVTWKPLKFDSKDIVLVSHSIERAFNDQESSDLKFMVDGKLIYVHKAILKIRCEHFQTMFKETWEENKQDVIEITSYSYPVYKAFLQFLYTDCLTLSPEDAISLLDLANCYCEFSLKKKCVQLIRQGITVENAAMLLAAAITYDASELEEFCFNFCIKHLTAVVQTESFSKLNEDTMKKFIIDAGKNGAFKF